MNENPRPGVRDVWEAGEAYGVFMGRWSRLVAREFLPWLAVPPMRDWLDIGCGTGMLSQAILDLAGPASVRGIDQSAGFISFAGNHVQDPRASFATGSADALPSEPHSFDAVVSGLVLNFITPPERAVAEMRRVARTGAVVAAYVWDYAGRMEFLRRFWDAAMALDPGAAGLDEGARFPLCDPERLRMLFHAGGLQHVEVRPIDVETRFTDFQDYWSPFLSRQGPAPSYVASLGSEQTAQLRDRLRRAVPLSGDGAINLIARAWAVKGISP